ncbi:hypothetical protein RFI_34950 [Reticulomyxa filosa]|uniref:Uncharacterized protein n=1 Tax=Reticulomyxa filosa TaxID=46433 RepID=X6LMA1_RETFI|nr:hypothetical protein RFI_34950 [Reticulomyxa filosa]|eukprot:ETO02481.1 hypothetical protein RFI_34950 [Reticulomyxa filosa]
MEEKEVEQWIDIKVEPPKEWDDIRQQMKELDNSLELWECDGKAHLANETFLSYMGDIVTIMADLFPLGNTIDVGDFKLLTFSFKKLYLQKYKIYPLRHLHICLFLCRNKHILDDCSKTDEIAQKMFTEKRIANADLKKHCPKDLFFEIQTLQMDIGDNRRFLITS